MEAGNNWLPAAKTRQHYDYAYIDDNKSTSAKKSPRQSFLPSTHMSVYKESNGDLDIHVHVCIKQSNCAKATDKLSVIIRTICTPERLSHVCCVGLRNGLFVDATMHIYERIYILRYILCYGYNFRKLFSVIKNKHVQELCLICMYFYEQVVLKVRVQVHCLVMVSSFRLEFEWA